MTSSHAAPDLSTGTDHDALASQLRPILEREHRRESAHEAIGWRAGAATGAAR